MRISRELGDKKVYKESTLYHYIVKALRVSGEDVIRKIPDKDNCMFSAPYYIRDRKRTYCYIHNEYAFYTLNARFNEHGTVILYKHVF